MADIHYLNLKGWNITVEFRAKHGDEPMIVEANGYKDDKQIQAVGETLNEVGRKLIDLSGELSR